MRRKSISSIKRAYIRIPLLMVGFIPLSIWFFIFVAFWAWGNLLKELWPAFKSAWKGN
jgi:hypothetical protein